MLRQMNNSGRASQLLLPLGKPEAAPLWRPINYLGSKLRLAKSIQKHIAELDPSSGKVCDLFAGSGTVSLALSQDRMVVAADIQEYSRVLCTALLQPAILDEALLQRLFTYATRAQARFEECLSPVLELEQTALATAVAHPTLLCDLAEHGSLLTPKTTNTAVSKALHETNLRIKKMGIQLTATTYFGGIYFSYYQTLYIDCLLYAIDNLPVAVRDTCLAAVLSTASTIVNSVGKQFAQPMRPRRKDGTVKIHVIQQMCRDRCLDTVAIFSGWLSQYQQLEQIPGNRVIRGDFREVFQQVNDVAVVYADPPYTRDHYSRFYHVLETLSLRDSPAISTTSLTGTGNNSRGIYRAQRHQSPFCIKSQAPTAFNDLFQGCHDLGVPVLVSYSPYIKNGHPRLLTVDAVSEVAKKHYRHVKIESAQPITHSKLNKSMLHLDASENAEVFISCRN